MIITKSEPYTSEEIEQLRETLDPYVKTVIDLDKKICSAGMSRHFEGEEILLEQGSRQSNVWGGGIDLETKAINFDSVLNIRSQDDNSSSEIQNPELRDVYKSLTKFFFAEIYQ